LYLLLSSEQEQIVLTPPSLLAALAFEEGKYRLSMGYETSEKCLYDVII
jgi:hypothetical protein